MCLIIVVFIQMSWSKKKSYKKIMIESHMTEFSSTSEVFKKNECWKSLDQFSNNYQFLLLKFIPCKFEQETNFVN